MTGMLKVLSGALVLQLAVAGVLTLGDSAGGSDSGTAGPLLAINRDNLSSIRMQDNESELELSKVDGKWVLPASENYPVNESQVNALLDKLEAMRRDVPVATSREARERFRVGEDEYQRHLQLFAGSNRVASLYLGTSTGRGMSHIRIDGEDSIHSVRLASFDMPLSGNSWENKTLLQFERNDLQQISLEDLTVIRAASEDGADGRVWQASEGLAEGETLNAGAVERLVGSLATLRVDRHVPQEEAADLALEDDTLAFAVTLNEGEPRRYELRKYREEDAWLLRVSDQPWAMRIAQWAGQGIRDNAVRSALVESAAEESAPAANETTDSGSQDTSANS